MEICHVPKMDCPSVYPGLYLFAAAGRLIRPVENVLHGMPEYLGIFEQVYLTVTYDDKECSLDGVSKRFLMLIVSFYVVQSFVHFIHFRSSTRNWPGFPCCQKWHVSLLLPTLTRVVGIFSSVRWASESTSASSSLSKTSSKFVNSLNTTNLF